MGNYLLLAIIGGLFGFYLFIGWRASKQVKGDEDYFLMGRRLTVFPLCFTLLATQLGGGTLLGAAQEAYTKGWMVLFYPLGASLGLFALGLGFGGRLRRMQISTIPEIFEKVYQLPSMRLVASLISMCSLYFILVGQGMATKKFFVTIGKDSPAYFIFFWIVFVAYTVMGGLKAVVDTDVWQALFILVTLVVAVFSADLGSVEWRPSFDLDMLSASDIPWASWLLMPFCFMLIEQDMGQRCFAAKSAKVVAPATMMAGLLLMLGSGTAIMFGVLAKEKGLAIEPDTTVLVAAIEAFTNPTVATFFMAVILMAIVSTADSLLCSISSHLSCDLIRSNNIPPQQKLIVSRIMTFVTGISALALVYYFDSVVTMLMLSYELSVSVLFVPVLMAIILSSPSRQGAMGAMIAGAIGFGLFRVWSLPLPREVLTLLLSLLGYAVGMMRNDP
ncbi:MAG: sodium:solute symporter family protein [Bacteroidota bacterium]